MAIPRPIVPGPTTSTVGAVLQPPAPVGDSNMIASASPLQPPAPDARAILGAPAPIFPPPVAPAHPTITSLLAPSANSNMIASASPLQPPAPDARAILGAPAPIFPPPAPPAHPTITSLPTSDCNLLENATVALLSDKNNGIKKRGRASSADNAPTVAPKRPRRQPMQDITERNIIRSQANKRLIKPSGKLRDGLV
jgi:hypothetical protein